jgi:hypothetical protein
MKKTGTRKKHIELPCVECGSKSKSEGDLQLHMKTAHPTITIKSILPEAKYQSINVSGECQFLCNVCDFSSKSKKGVKQHTTVKHGKPCTNPIPEIQMIVESQCDDENETFESIDKCSLCCQPLGASSISTEIETCVKCNKKEHETCAVGTINVENKEYICPPCTYEPIPVAEKSMEPVKENISNIIFLKFLLMVKNS